MDLKEFFSQYPLPPNIPAGKRAKFTFDLTQDEWQLLNNVANSPSAYFDGGMGKVVRWLLYHWIQLTEDMLKEKDLYTLSHSLHDSLRLGTLDMALHEIEDYLDKRARELNLLLDMELNDQAGLLWQQTRRMVQQQPELPRKALKARMAQHPEIIRFRGRYLKEDPTGLQQIERDD